MRNRNIILLTFLLFLYIGPSLFAMTSHSLPTLTEQNMSKEFQISDGAGWLDGWNYRQSVLITGSVGAGTNYQILLNVTYDSHMQIDFDDLRFTDNDGSTLLDYWLEIKTNNMWAVFWVEVKDDLDSEQTIYMYYGNDTVSTTSNIDNTFIWADDFENNNLNKWSVPGAAWSTSPTAAKYGSYGAYGNGQSTGRALEEDLADISTNCVVMFWAQSVGATVGMLPQYHAVYSFAGGASTVYAMVLAGDVAGDPIMYYNGSSYNQWGSLSFSAATWFHGQIAYDFTNDLMYMWKDGVSAGAGVPLKDANGNIFTSITKLISLCPSTTSDLYLDDYIVRKWVDDGPIFDSFGDEQSIPEWQEVGDAELVFSIPIDETALNWFLILLGMFMVPASTLYLVKGGKNNMSMDKVFYFIVAFLFGWGLIFIGVN